MRRRLVRLLPPLLLAAATLWLNRDGPQRQLGIARHEARRALSPQGFRANGPYVDEPRTLVARNRDAGPPHILTADPRRPAADERAVLEALSWEAAPAAPGFGPAAAAPADALLVVPADRRTDRLRGELLRDGWMLADREGGTEAWRKLASGDGFHWEADELDEIAASSRLDSPPPPLPGGSVSGAAAEAAALLCLLLPVAAGWRRSGETGAAAALAAEVAAPFPMLALHAGNAACATAALGAAWAAALLVPKSPPERTSIAARAAALLLFAALAAAALPHTLLATNGLGTVGGKAKLLHLCGGFPAGFFDDPGRAVLQPAYPPGFAVLTHAVFCLRGGASQWLVQLLPCAAQAFCLLLLCRAAPSAAWIPFLTAAFLSDPALCLPTMYYPEPLACVFLLCGWNLLEEGRVRPGWGVLGMTAWVKNEFVLLPPLVWLARRVFLGDRRCRFPHAALALLPFAAWFAYSRALGATLYDYAPPWAPDPARAAVAARELARLAFGEPWRYGWAYPAGVAALAALPAVRLLLRRPPSAALRRAAAGGALALACAAGFVFFLSLSRAPDFRWHCKSLFRLLFPPALLALRIAAGSGAAPFRRAVDIFRPER